jgi:hypothetical protein
MATADQFKFGSIYTFTTYSPNVLGTFNAVKVEGITDYQGALKENLDPAAMHANVYGSLPEHTAVDDHRSYYYLIVTMSNGQRRAIGLPWIDGTTVQLISRLNAVVSIPDVGPDDIIRIKNALISNGFNVGSVRLTE